MNHTQEVTILSLVRTIQRAVRALEQIQDHASEDELKQRFGRFITEHVTLLEHLRDLIDLEKQAIQATPQAFIQFPNSQEDLLKVAAKSEKQAIDEVKRIIASDVNPEATKILKKYQSNLAGSYDYIQALYDLLI